MERLRVGWLAPEDCRFPPGETGGSLTTLIWKLAQQVAAQCDLVIATRELQTGGTTRHDDGSIRLVRHEPVADLRRGAFIDQLNRIERRLRLPDLPYAARASYFRGYARAHAANLRDARVDIVHLHNTSQWVPLLRAALPEVPIVLQMHSEWLAEIPYDDGIARLRQIDRVLAVSEQVADQIRARFPERADIVHVLPNGVDAGVFVPAAEVRDARAAELAALRRQLGLGDGPVVVFVGRLSAEKGLHVLIEAVPSILARVPGVSVVLVGPAFGLRSPLPTRRRRELAGRPEWRARYVDHLQRLAAEAPCPVRLAGPLPWLSLPLAYALADVYVQPSVFDAFPLPPLEAMASGLPVVATTAGGLPEMVADGVTGLLVPPGDPEALADAVARVLEQPELAGRLGRAGRERVLREFGWEAVADRLLDDYAVLAGERATRVPQHA